MFHSIGILHTFRPFVFGAARLIYLVRCPSFLMRYGSAAEASADGMTVEIVKDHAADYLTRFQGKKLHPLSDEGRAVHKLLTEFVGPNQHVKKTFEGRSTESFDAVVSGSHVMEVVSSGTFVTGFTKKDFDDHQKQKSKNLPIWRLIELQNLSSVYARMLMTIIVWVGFFLIATPIAQGLIAVSTRCMAG